MSENEKNKVKKFVSDEIMLNAVYNIIHKSFLKFKGQRDTQLLAAERLALDFLDEAWKELEKYKKDEHSISQPLRQVGL